ncbi:metallophosphoesterase family protein [Burkholderia stabilis]|uniref:metallophosphoesterase family protein n=1 Tax=Burkholderia stabilis TaxID=95485 RepID=UPI00158DF16A|nr:metallophosphoesterase [Burkholderia stabilis]HDR9488664.1 metallophosphoesterase [Burkholderia stabilis]HDR9523679.1 metallophosphoesterase [Burkholderia stabilis]HDR9531415.1 metallophosphoesterase [Burkholderia stabilis]HDR9541033.1 metallophosphoesterase [Burkholderia stabilis]HDR9544023.1 metallophosphoesterase [Burkholderia stabilis]
MVTFLHISDLHRDSGSGLTTRSLLESLRLDRERYIAEGLPQPDIAIVSGDIVYGVTKDDSSSDAALRAQYDEAYSFLVDLSDLFFSGNRDRIVIVPGNHDISHPHVLRSTVPEDIPTDGVRRKLIARQLGEDESLWRWVWADFSLRRISDRNEYAERLKPFAIFYDSFYEGRRRFSLEPSQQLSLHDFPELGVVVAGLSSCCDNDLFNRCGRIHPDCIAGATRDVADLVRLGRISIAVWHHNLAGGPKDSDYVEAEFLQSLMDGGFALGFHGHQHRPQFIEHRFTADNEKAIAVISAGTLCGGPRTLPSGRMRAYNLVCVDTATGQCSLHVRDMKNSNFSSPVWGPANVPEFGGSSMSFELKISPNARRPVLMDVPPVQNGGDESGQAAQVAVNEKLALEAASEAVRLLRGGKAQPAIEIVLPYLSNPLARRVAVEALLELDKWEDIERLCSPPQSNAELIALMEAQYQLGHRPQLRALIESETVTMNQDAAVRQSVDQARARLGGGR